MASQEEDNKLECISNVNKEQERYYLNVYKKFESILNDKSETFEKKVQSLIEVWKSISELNFAQFDFKYLIQIIDWAKLHALNIVLTGEWRKIKDCFRDSLLEFIEKAQASLASINSAFSARCQKLADVVRKPWEDPVLKNLIQDKEAKIESKEIEFFCVETAYLVSVRLKKLCENHCEDLALNLVTNFLKYKNQATLQNLNLNATETQLWFIFDIYIALLYKFQDKTNILQQFEELPLEEGIQLIKRFAKKRVKISKIWRNCHKIAIFGSRFFLSKALIKYNEDLKETLTDLLKTYLVLSNTDTLLEEFIVSMRNLTNLADAEGLCVMCEVIQKDASDKLIPFAIEMYIRALTTDMNELERLKHVNEEDKVKLTTSRLAHSFTNLGELLDEHVKVSRECILTAFSLEPTKDRLKRIIELARRSGYEVLDTGQEEWKCRLHPPVLPSDDLVWMCPECGEWMCKPELTAPLQTNTPLQEALQESVLGITEALCDDLVVCLSNPRYQILSWVLAWNDLHRLCILYLNDPEKTKNFVTELKFVDVDYSQFDHIKREPLDEFTGIEKGYEQYLDMDFVSDEGTSSVSEDSMSHDRYVGLGSDGTGDCHPFSQTKSDPNTLKSLRMFRPNLKRKKEDGEFPLQEKKTTFKSPFDSFNTITQGTQGGNKTWSDNSYLFKADGVTSTGSGMSTMSNFSSYGSESLLAATTTSQILSSCTQSQNPVSCAIDLSEVTSTSYVSDIIKSNLTFGVPKVSSSVSTKPLLPSSGGYGQTTFSTPNILTKKSTTQSSSSKSSCHSFKNTKNQKKVSVNIPKIKVPSSQMTNNTANALDAILNEAVKEINTEPQEQNITDSKNVVAATLPQLGGQVAHNHKQLIQVPHQQESHKINQIQTKLPLETFSQSGTSAACKMKLRNKSDTLSPNGEASGPAKKRKKKETPIQKRDLQVKIPRLNLTKHITTKSSQQCNQIKPLVYNQIPIQMKELTVRITPLKFPLVATSKPETPKQDSRPKPPLKRGFRSVFAAQIPTLSQQKIVQAPTRPAPKQGFLQNVLGCPVPAPNISEKNPDFRETLAIEPNSPRSMLSPAPMKPAAELVVLLPTLAELDGLLAAAPPKMSAIVRNVRLPMSESTRKTKTELGVQLQTRTAPTTSKSELNVQSLIRISTVACNTELDVLLPMSTLPTQTALELDDPLQIPTSSTTSKIDVNVLFPVSPSPISFASELDDLSRISTSITTSKVEGGVLLSTATSPTKSAIELDVLLPKPAEPTSCPPHLNLEKELSMVATSHPQVPVQVPPEVVSPVLLRLDKVLLIPEENMKLILSRASVSQGVCRGSINLQHLHQPPTVPLKHCEPIRGADHTAVMKFGLKIEEIHFDKDSVLDCHKKTDIQSTKNKQDMASDKIGTNKKTSIVKLLNGTYNYCTINNVNKNMDCDKLLTDLHIDIGCKVPANCDSQTQLAGIEEQFGELSNFSEKVALQESNVLTNKSEVTEFSENNVNDFIWGAAENVDKTTILKNLIETDTITMDEEGLSDSENLVCEDCTGKSTSTDLFSTIKTCEAINNIDGGDLDNNIAKDLNSSAENLANENSTRTEEPTYVTNNNSISINGIEDYNSAIDKTFVKKIDWPSTKGVDKITAVLENLDDKEDSSHFSSSDLVGAISTKSSNTEIETKLIEISSEPGNNSTEKDLTFNTFFQESNENIAGKQVIFSTTENISHNYSTSKRTNKNVNYMKQLIKYSLAEDECKNKSRNIKQQMIDSLLLKMFFLQLFDGDFRKLQDFIFQRRTKIRLSNVISKLTKMLGTHKTSYLLKSYEIKMNRKLGLAQLDNIRFFGLSILPDHFSKRHTISASWSLCKSLQKFQKEKVSVQQNDANFGLWNACKYLQKPKIDKPVNVPWDCIQDDKSLKAKTNTSDLHFKSNNDSRLSQSNLLLTSAISNTKYLLKKYRKIESPINLEGSCESWASWKSRKSDLKIYSNNRKRKHDGVPCFKLDQERNNCKPLSVELRRLPEQISTPKVTVIVPNPKDCKTAILEDKNERKTPFNDFTNRNEIRLKKNYYRTLKRITYRNNAVDVKDLKVMLAYTKLKQDKSRENNELFEKISTTSSPKFIRVPGLHDYSQISPRNLTHVVNVVQHSIPRSSAVTNQNTQTSTQVTPHIQRIGQPKLDRKPEHFEEVPEPSSSTVTSAPSTSQSSTLINILSSPKTNQKSAQPRQTPFVNILSQQILRPSSDHQTATVIKVEPENHADVQATNTVNTNLRIVTTTTQAGASTTTSSSSQGGAILQFICKSSSLPKFQQAFGKTVYQTGTTAEGGTSETPVPSSAVTNQTQTSTVAESKKVATKAVPVNVQPITGNVIFRGQVPIGQTVSLIPPGSNTRQLFRITGSTHEQISLVKETVIQNKMSALLAAALQGKPKITEQNGELVEEYSATRITLCRPGSVPPNATRIVKPVQLQIPANVIRAPQPNVSSTTLEQLREFDMVYKQVKERSSNPAQPETTSQTTQESPPQQRISFTYVNQVQKYTQLSPVVVVTSYSPIQQSVSPAVSVTSQSGTSSGLTQVSTVVVPKVAVKSSKGKSIKSTVVKTSPTTSVPTITKPQQKPQEDEHTTQRIFDILAEYAEQLRNSPDLNNKPAPRRRSNPPTNPSSNTSTSLSKKKKKKSTSSSTSNLVETDNEDLTMGSEDSSGGNVVQLSMTDEEQSQSASITPPESNLEPATSNAQTPRPLFVTDTTSQPRNVIIADSSVGEALKMPNTALLMPGNYIMPVSVVKGGQQIAVVSGGSKILTTVPARSGQNMLLLQSFVNQNKKGGISTVKYSTLQPFSTISQNVTTVNSQTPVVLPSNSVSTVSLGQPITLKKLDDNERGNSTELLLTIAQPREVIKVDNTEVPQPDSSTNLPCEAIEVQIDEGSSSRSSNNEVFNNIQGTNSVATSVIASVNKKDDEGTTTGDSSMKVDDIQTPVQKQGERMGSVLVNASTSNGPMLSHTNTRYRKPTEVVESTSASTKEFNHIVTKVPQAATRILKNNTVYYAIRTKKAVSKKIDSEMQKQAAIERELRLQKTLSEECEDLGVDEPSTSDLFPEADLLFDSNHSPSYDQSGQKIQGSEVKTKGSMHLFSDDENSGPLRNDLFDYVEYHPPEPGIDQVNGTSIYNESASSCDDSTLLPNCGAMSEVTLNSPISLDYPDNSHTVHKYKYKYTNRKKGEKFTRPSDNWQEVTEVTSSEDAMELVKEDDTPIAIQEETVIDESVTEVEAVAVENPKNCEGDTATQCPIHNSVDNKGSRKKTCLCFNGSDKSPSKKRFSSPKSQGPNTCKKVLINKKR